MSLFDDETNYYPGPISKPGVRNLRVGFTGQSEIPAGGIWYPRFGSVDDWFGDPNVVTIIPSADENSGDVLICSEDIFVVRIYLRIQNEKMMEQFPVILTLFLDGVGFQRSTSSPVPNHRINHQRIVMEYGNIEAGVELALAMFWDGDAPLTIDLNLSYMVISYLENSSPES